MEEIITTDSESQTFELGKQFSKKIKPGDVIFLKGDLGAGKTTFVKGLAEGLGITKRIISPTFVIVRTHSLKGSSIKNLYHLDLYRLGTKEDVIGIDLKDYLEDETGIVAIEWPNVAQDFINKEVWNVSFAVKKENKREIKLFYGKN